jgi:hypothetical protein
VVAEAEAVAEEAGTEVVVAGARPIRFAAGGTVDAPGEPAGPGWEMKPGAPGYRTGKVGFADLGAILDKESPRQRKNRSGTAKSAGAYFSQGLAQLRRDAPLIEDSHALVAEIERVTKFIGGDSSRPVSAKALTAAGGWCAPSEQLYDFCDVPDATDLISLPELTINRGGVRWPVEPDLTGIFDEFQFFFTEPELEAVDGGGNATAIKECVTIPCPAEFEEIRLNAVGYCVEAGILQTQGWPELITWFMQQLAQEHLRAISRRTILDMVNGSGSPTVISAGTTIGATSAVLNSIALMATNLRLQRGLSRQATIEGVAPSWLLEALRADLAMMEGTDTKSVTDGQIIGWFNDRNISLQLVGDWQSRDTGLPGNLATVAWPAHVDVLMYPAGAWFRSMANVIELGVMYPKEQLQVNAYTRLFTEDGIAVGKRCYRSEVARIPLCVNGGIGARISITCPDPTTTLSSGGVIDVTPAPSGAFDHGATSKTATFTGTVSGGTFTLTYDGKVSAPIAWNATATVVAAALVAIDDGYNSGDFTVTGGPAPGTPLVITTPGGSLTVSGTSLTGSSPVVTLS